MLAFIYICSGQYNYLATSYLSYFDDRLDSSSYEDWSTEENLVKSTVDTGNDRLLTNSQITEFIKSCQACNCDKVLELLCQSLQSTDGPLLMVGTSKNDRDTQNQRNNMLFLHVVLYLQRALLLVEYLLRTDIYGINQISEACGKYLLNISEGKASPQTSKAKKVNKNQDRIFSYFISITYYNTNLK